MPIRLNLTAAAYIHIVEPQWNPSVEQQAIGRALRLGQTQTVTVIRYIMRNSVEEVRRRTNGLADWLTDRYGIEYSNPSRGQDETC
jgi:hypothetical protein